MISEICEFFMVSHNLFRPRKNFFSNHQLAAATEFLTMPPSDVAAAAHLSTKTPNSAALSMFDLIFIVK